MNYRTLADLSKLIRENLHQIPEVDAVVGIPRSGTIAAAMIATLKNLPLGNFAQCDTILLVDDSISGGETMKRQLELISAKKVLTLAVFRKPESPQTDIWFEEVPGPRVFEWQWYRSKYLKRAVLDIDGVISTPTVPHDRWKGQLLYRPTKRPLALATGRWECERAFTEDWLHQHEVPYDQLFMSQEGGAARRVKLKAAIATGASWIVESNIKQAEWLRVHAKIPVLCVDANRMLLPL